MSSRAKVAVIVSACVAATAIVYATRADLDDAVPPPLEAPRAAALPETSLPAQLGRWVTVRGTVALVHGPRAFVLAGTEPVLVISRRPLVIGDGGVALGAGVAVEGVVRAFDVDVLSDAVGAPVLPWRRPLAAVILADSVTDLDGRDLAATSPRAVSRRSRDRERESGILAARAPRAPIRAEVAVVDPFTPLPARAFPAVERPTTRSEEHRRRWPEVIVSAGAGIERSVGDVGATSALWDVRALVRRRRVGFELGYLGSSTVDGAVIGSAVQLLAWWSLRPGASIEPYVVGGVGWRHYDVRAGATDASVFDDDDLLEVPVGAGVAYRRGAWFGDLRATAAPTLGIDPATPPRGDRPARAANLAVTVRVGHAF